MGKIHDEKWEQNFILLQEFYAEYGMFPKQKDVYKGVKLGLWGANQRRDASNGKCRPERYKKLYESGFLQSNTFDTNWELNFQKLMLFLDEYGRFPVEDEVYSYFNIGKWCSNQKLKAKSPNYPKDRYDRLNRIGFFDNTRETKWEQRYQLLCEFVEEFHCLPAPTEVYKDFRIGTWCTLQKNKCKKPQYPVEHIRKLTEIGLIT